MVMKKKVTVLQRLDPIHFVSSYEVVRLFNTTTPRTGEFLSEADVSGLIAEGIEVEVKPEKM